MQVGLLGRLGALPSLWPAAANALCARGELSGDWAWTRDLGASPETTHVAGEVLAGLRDLLWRGQQGHVALLGSQRLPTALRNHEVRSCSGQGAVTSVYAELVAASSRL